MSKEENHIPEGSKKNATNQKITTGSPLVILVSKSADYGKPLEIPDTHTQVNDQTNHMSDKSIVPLKVTDGSVKKENFGEWLVSSPKLMLERPHGHETFSPDQDITENVALETGSASKNFKHLNERGQELSGEFSLSETIPTEETPLIPGPDLENWAGVGTGVSERTSVLLQNRRLWKIIMYLLLLLLLMLVLLFFVDFQKLANEAFTTELQSVSILGIHNRGVDFLVIGTVEANYDNISSSLLRYLARAGSLLIGGVIVASRDNCSIYVTFDEVVGAHLLDVFPPEIPVDLIDHRISEVEFISDAIIADGGAVQIIKSVLSHGVSKPLNIKVEIRLSPKILAKWFSFTLKTASIFHDLSLPLNKYTPPLAIDSLLISDRNNHMDVGFSSGWPPIPASFSIGQIEWNAAIADCDMQPVNIGAWKTSSMRFKPNLVTEFQVSGTLEELPSSLVQACSNGLTPVNNFARLFVNDKLLSTIISVKSSESNQKLLPEWLFNILTKLSASVSIPIPHIRGGSDHFLNCNYVIDSSNLIIKTDEFGILKIMLDTKTHVEIKSASRMIDLNLSASKIKSKLTLLGPNRTLLEALIPGSSTINLIPQSPTSDKVYLDLNNVSASINDPRLAGQYLNSVLSEKEVNVPDWSVDLEEMYLELPLMSIFLKDLRFKSEKMNQNNYINHRQANSTFVDWLLQNVHVMADQIFCVSSSPEQVKFLVDFQITNPLNVSLEVINDILSFDVRYNGSTVGKLLLENFKVLDSRERTMLTANLTLFYKSATQRILLEDFLSHLISGSENTLVGIAGSQADYVTEESGLSKLLQEVKIDGVRLPQLNFTHKDVSKWNLQTSISDRRNDIENRNNDLELKKSPFLVDATFHLWSSEIELTVFNPIANVELEVKILSCLASYKGESLAHIEGSEILIIPPGVHLTPRIPIEISNGLGADILRKAINGDLAMDVVAELSVCVDKFPAELMYRGSGLTAKVKI